MITSASTYPASWVYTPRLPGEPPIRSDRCRWATLSARGVRQCPAVCKEHRDAVSLCPTHARPWDARMVDHRATAHLRVRTAAPRLTLAQLRAAQDEAEFADAVYSAAYGRLNRAHGLGEGHGGEKTLVSGVAQVGCHKGFKMMRDSFRNPRVCT